MLSSIFFWSELAVAVLLIGFFAEHRFFNRNNDMFMVIASEQRKQ